MKKILLVDDDPEILRCLGEEISHHGYKVFRACDGETGLNSFNICKPDLVILDVALPSFSGLELCQIIRNSRDLNNIVPIIMISARKMDIDRITGLEVGADDYLGKPVNVKELMLKIKRMLSRVDSGNPCFGLIQIGKLKMDQENYQVWWEGNLVELTVIEWKLLDQLVKKPSKIISRESFLDKIWDHSSEVFSRTVDTHVKRIRKKFKDVGCGSIIETIRGRGYKLGDIN